MAMHAFLLAGMPNPDAHAAIGRSKDGGDGSEAIMSSVPAARLRPEFRCRQIDLVMHDHDRFGRQLEEARRSAHRPAALLHVGRRLQQNGLAPGEGSFRDDPFEAPAPWPELVALMNDIHGHEADIVPVARIRLAGIAQPGDQKGILAHKENEISELRNRKAEKIASGCRIPRSDYFFSGPLPAAAGALPAAAAGV